MYDNQLGKLIFWVWDWSERLNIAIYCFKRQLETAEYSPQCKIEALFPDILNSNFTEWKRGGCTSNCYKFILV